MVTAVVEGNNGQLAVKSMGDKNALLILFIFRCAHNEAPILTLSSEI